MKCTHFIVALFAESLMFCAGTIALRILTATSVGLATRWRRNCSNRGLQLHGLSNPIDVADSMPFKIVAPLTSTISDAAMFVYI
jgi:hypothetical protein